ncbi:Intermediate conductance calcium-activated potassium channel protein 4 [Chelonia mydas]|uniref:Intermediate conductance calcium-activated potassium channel protein 4 n=1 Tax=Chelonia mydas TaxID=8469 RepID=M7ANF2_CHEMY|nr:Intermediate conductance calcium-activated potassium channel protein 4 [Chelonia mydas]
MKNSAANVLQAAWLFHKHSTARAGRRARTHHRRLLAAIHRFREVRVRHRKLRDQVNALVDVSQRPAGTQPCVGLKETPLVGLGMGGQQRYLVAAARNRGSKVQEGYTPTGGLSALRRAGG